MTKQLQTLGFVFAFALAATALASAQEKDKDKTQTPTPAAAKNPPPPAVPLKIQIQIGRYQGEKKISSMPYTLSIVTGRGGANLRMGTKVPVTMSITNLAKDALKGAGKDLLNKELDKLFPLMPKK